MFVRIEEYNTWQQYKPLCKKCTYVCTLMAAVIFFMLMIIFLATLSLEMTQRIHVVYVEDEVIGNVDEKFLSIALDSSVIAGGFHNFNMSDQRMIKLMKAMSPSYFRIGGNLADRLIFSKSKYEKYKRIGETDGGACSYENTHCKSQDRENFTMSAREWLDLNQLAKDTGLRLIFDLNVLRRFENDSWDYRNAKKLISFSNQNGLDLDWELGNEPNAFRHQFNYEVSATQLGKDFFTLKEILKEFPKYRNSLLVGPDVTRPEVVNKASQIFLEEFLKEAGHTVDAITWHQYYFNGRLAKLPDFLDPEIFDTLKCQIATVREIAKRNNLTLKPIWLGETASAYGGGAPDLSNRYVATFIWLDKLGIAAKYGLDVVVRQSIFQGNYALINSDYTPSPDWWISVIYKKLVAPKVVSCFSGDNPNVRLYCQCTQPEYQSSGSSVTVFGVNLSKEKVKIRIEGILKLQKSRDLKIHSYVLNSENSLDSKDIYLNGVLLRLTQNYDLPPLKPKDVVAHPYVEMPAYSSAFWVIPGGKMC